MNYKIIRHILSSVLRIEAACMLLSLICAFIYDEADIAKTWLLSIAICLIVSFAISWRRPQKKELYSREGFVAVALSWIVISIFGALPFILSGHIPNVFDAIFETVSGFTTTGASILKDVEALPKSLLFWRSFTHWIGGMGVLVFLVAILPVSGGNNFYLMKAESPGPAVSKLVPKVRHTAKILYLIYLALTVVQIVMLYSGDMDLFEAITLTFGTAGTGGFSIRNSGLADYSSYSQIVTTVFMIIFGVDFSLYHLILMKKSRLIFKSDELKGYLGIILLSIIFITINCSHLFTSIGETIKHASFQVASIITTTGYATTDFNKWPEFSKAILLMLMFVGACAGSTGGGVKVSRLIILLKSIVKEVRIVAHPKAALKLNMNGRPIEHETIRGVNVYMAAYIMIFIVSVILVSIDNMDFLTTFSSVLTAMGNVGPGLGVVGPAGNFSSYSDFSIAVLTIDMLIGRLEIFPVLILLSPYTWKK